MSSSSMVVVTMVRWADAMARRVVMVKARTISFAIAIVGWFVVVVVIWMIGGGGNL